MAAFVANRGTGVLSRDIGDYPEGIIIPVDKPYRWTSADVVRKLKFAAKKHFGQKNLKVGHAGTLDPLATGVLIVCVGKATKLAEEIQRSDKEYVAGITFGATTPSYDLEKPIDRLFPVEGVSEASVARALEGFIGEQEQIAPLFSAKSVDGVRAYELARKLYRKGSLDALGNEAEALLSRQIIRINEIDLLSFKEGDFSASLEMTRRCLSFEPDNKLSFRQDNVLSSRQDNVLSSRQDNGLSSRQDNVLSFRPDNVLSFRPESEGRSGEISTPSNRINVTDNSALGLPHAEVRLSCSKGTYVRAFARDLGEALDTGAHLDSLHRTACGGFRAADALSIEQATALFALSGHDISLPMLNNK